METRDRFLTGSSSPARAGSGSTTRTILVEKGINAYGFINKAKFDGGFTDRLKLKDGAVTAVKDPGHELEPQVVTDFRMRAITDVSGVIKCDRFRRSLEHPHSREPRQTADDVDITYSYPATRHTLFFLREGIVFVVSF
ncbi:hypothetical protein DPX16_22900 [Anabarilius grahami]|uniref:Uncharacterized protein n=1 Tax=Anabarilius grahami TaxID=495550 RepID=A0A3N0XM51_ANAGA|nr:hypothetical protein DPX16_22900 [Anabarilius grahami]